MKKDNALLVLAATLCVLSLVGVAASSYVVPHENDVRGKTKTSPSVRSSNTVVNAANAAVTEASRNAAKTRKVSAKPQESPPAGRKPRKPYSEYTPEELEEAGMTPWGLYSARQGKLWYQAHIAVMHGGNVQLGSELRQLALAMWRSGRTQDTQAREQLMSSERAMLKKTEVLALDGESAMDIASASQTVGDYGPWLVREKMLNDPVDPYPSYRIDDDDENEAPAHPVREGVPGGPVAGTMLEVSDESASAPAEAREDEEAVEHIVPVHGPPEEGEEEP